jgi:release factor glutamine methyltransferase
MSDDQTRVWTIRELMKSAIEHFQRKGFEEARLNVELLLAHALEIQRIQLYLHFDKPLTQEELKKFRILYERRLKHEPVQYIIGTASFMGLKFSVDPRVLIPRPETETLVEQAMLFCQKFTVEQPIHILEIGTGSGNIAISIAKFIKHANVTTIDISREALIVAENNARHHSVESKIQFACTDIFNRQEKLLKSQYDLLISNPPYVPKDEWEQLQKEIRDYEPPYAVTDGKDGYNFYHRIANIIPEILNPNGGVILEVGFGQSEKVVKVLKRAGIGQLQIIRDLQGIPRVVSGALMGSYPNLINLN